MALLDENPSAVLFDRMIWAAAVMAVAAAAAAIINKNISSVTLDWLEKGWKRATS